jgi:hypothetical protein
MNDTEATQEDRRAAASLVTTLSSLVITASLAVLGAQAVITTFVIDKRENLGAFYVVALGGAAALIGSIVLGGLGVYEIASAGARGKWKVTTEGRKFDLQSLLALFGTALVITSAFLGDAKPQRSAGAVEGAATHLRLRATEMPRSSAELLRHR